MPVFSPASLICVWRWHHSDFAVHFLSVSLTLAPNGRASGRCNLHCHSSPAAEMFRWRARRQYQISTPNSLCILLPSTGRSAGLTNACRLASPPFQSSPLSPSSPTSSRHCHTAALLPLRRRSAVAPAKTPRRLFIAMRGLADGLDGGRSQLARLAQRLRTLHLSSGRHRRPPIVFRHR